MRRHLEPGASAGAKTEGGWLDLTPLAVVPRSVMLSSRGKLKEALAEQDLRASRVSTFTDAAELLAYLEQ